MIMEVNKIIQGDALEVLKTLPNESVDCVVTSPPYFNLRDYQVEGQIGLETTYQEFIQKLVDIFNETKRILKKEGTCFVNLGDTYAGGGFGADTNLENTKQFTNTGTIESRDKIAQLRKQNKQISQKSLMMIPERFAIAMMDAGWILRNKLVWIKRNAMPESVNDRWKKAHEYIFFFTKSKKYYFNLDKIRTKHSDISVKRADYELGRNSLGQDPSSMGAKSDKYGMPARHIKLNPLGAVPPDFLDINTNSTGEGGEHYATYPQSLISPLIRAGCPENGIVLDMFMGSGTTAIAARKQSCNFIGIDLNPDYIKIAEKRLAQQLLF